MNKRNRYILTRAGLSLVSLFAVATLLFLIFRLLPGDPTTAVVAPQMSQQARQQLAAQYGVDQPLYIQYVLYMKNLIMGDFGVSFRYNKPVAMIIPTKLLNTLILMVTSVVLAYVLGILIGAFFAWQRNTAIDVYGTALVLIFYAAPVFWTGIIAIMLFSFNLHWLPSSGIHSVSFIADSFWQRYISIDLLKHLVLPVTVTTLYFLSTPMLTMRNNMIDVLDADFVKMAEAEGLSRFTILYRYAARNSLLPVMHYAAVSLGFAFGGSVIIETVFSWPGIGRMMWQATLSQDYPLAQAGFFILATVVIIMNFGADILSVYIDPRAVVNE